MGSRGPYHVYEYLTSNIIAELRVRFFGESGSISLRMGRVVSEILMMDNFWKIFPDATFCATPASRDYIGTLSAKLLFFGRACI